MIKEAYYFSHDSNSRNDEKIIALRMKHNWLGYGLFWAIIEKLRDSTDYMCVKDYNLIAFDLRVDASTIKSIVEDFGLFVFTEDGKHFYSERLKFNMERKSQRGKEMAGFRWGSDEDGKRKKADKCIFYIIKFYNESESFVKAGITNMSISRRYSGKLNGYNYDVILHHDTDQDKCLEIERKIKEQE